MHPKQHGKLAAIMAKLLDHKLKGKGGDIWIVGQNGHTAKVGAAESWELNIEHVYQKIAEALAYEAKKAYPAKSGHLKGVNLNSWYMGKIGYAPPPRTKRPRRKPKETLKGIEASLLALQESMPPPAPGPKDGWANSYLGQMYMYSDAAYTAGTHITLDVNGVALEGIESVEWEDVPGGVSAKVKMSKQGYDHAIAALNGKKIQYMMLDEQKEKP